MVNYQISHSYLNPSGYRIGVIEKWTPCFTPIAVVLAVLLDSPQLLIAEEEKMIIEEVKDDQTIMEEK